MPVRRRDVIALAGSAALVSQFARAEISSIRRVAYLSVVQVPQRYEAFLQGMADAGYVDGKTLSVIHLTAPTTNELPTLAAQAVSLNPDVIFAPATAASLAARNATGTIPIVFTVVADPVGSGLVTNLAHPGGNVTGNSNFAAGITTKQIGILKEIVPSLSRVAVLNVPAEPQAPLFSPPIQAAAKALDVEPLFIDFVETQDLAKQFERVIAAGVQAALVPAFIYWTSAASRDALFDLLIKHKLPAISANTTEGTATPFAGVVSYASNDLATYRRAAAFVVAILRGAKPGDLPIELPTTFDLSVNLDTARKIGITIPPSILAQATLVVDEDWRAPKGAAK